MPHNREMKEGNRTLYVRMGGYDVIAAVIDELLALMKTDPRFARFGTGRSADSHRRTRQLIVDQMCSLSGGPCFYAGRDMQTSHAGLRITEMEWQASMEHTAQALTKNGVADRERAEFLSLFEQYRSEIVET
jgi:hemoglobin